MPVPVAPEVHFYQLFLKHSNSILTKMLVVYIGSSQFIRPTIALLQTWQKTAFVGDLSRLFDGDTMEMKAIGHVCGDWSAFVESKASIHEWNSALSFWPPFQHSAWMHWFKFAIFNTQWISIFSSWAFGWLNGWVQCGTVWCAIQLFEHATYLSWVENALKWTCKIVIQIVHLQID